MSNATTITADFIKALRKAAKSNDFADRYWVRVEAIRHHSWNGTILTLAREHTNGDSASEYSTTFYETVGCERVSLVEHYGRIGQITTTARYCAVQNHYRSEKGLLTSLANTLRAGDEVRARFVLSNSTENLRNAGLEHDSCFLQIIRNGKFVCEFFVDDTICPSGSTALMSHQYGLIGTNIVKVVAPFITEEVVV